MKQLVLILCTILINLPAFSQVFKEDDAVEVFVLLADTAKDNWKKASVIGYDAATRTYKVKVADGDKMDIPSRDPEKWIRPVVDNQLMVKYGPGAKLPFQNRVSAIEPVDCRPSIRYIKKNLRSLMAAEHKDFEFIYVDVYTVKPQKSEDNNKDEGKFIYPYKTEMLVHLKRTLSMGGRLYTEYQTWEYDREYAFATRGKKNCEFYPLQHAGPKLISRGWFAQ